MTQTVLLRLLLLCGLFSIMLMSVDKRVSTLVVAVAGIVFLSLDLGMDDFWYHQTVVHPRKRTQGANNRSFANNEQTTQTEGTEISSVSNHQANETEEGDTQSTQRTTYTQTNTMDAADTHLHDDLTYGEFVADHTGPPRGVGARPICTLPGNDLLRRIEPVKKNQQYNSQTGRLSRYAWLS